MAASSAPWINSDRDSSPSPFASTYGSCRTSVGLGNLGYTRGLEVEDMDLALSAWGWIELRDYLGFIRLSGSRVSVRKCHKFGFTGSSNLCMRV